MKSFTLFIYILRSNSGQILRAPSTIASCSRCTFQCDLSGPSARNLGLQWVNSRCDIPIIDTITCVSLCFRFVLYYEVNGRCASASHNIHEQRAIRYAFGTTYTQTFSCKLIRLYSICIRSCTYLTKSNSVSAVYTGFCSSSSNFLMVLWPWPGPIVVTRMIPRTTALIVVVK